MHHFRAHPVSSRLIFNARERTASFEPTETVPRLENSPSLSYSSLPRFLSLATTAPLHAGRPFPGKERRVSQDRRRIQEAAVFYERKAPRRRARVSKRLNGGKKDERLAVRSRSIGDLHRLMNMLNQFRKTGRVRALVARARAARPRRPVIIVIAPRVKPPVENEPNVTCAGGSASA